MGRIIARVWLIALALVLVVSACQAQSTEEGDMYNEVFRPQVHYSPPCGWMNDPNGMVYYEGEYHLFYQFDPKSTSPGPMHWGHAVSTDLVHWQTLPIALYPDDIGPIWSGSVVVDANNTSGLVVGGGLVAIYSHQNQSQGVAYSTDKGRTWTKYAGNPVIPALYQDFRDPKVIWHEATQKWVMVIAAGRKLQIYTSPDLLHWEMGSELTGNLGAGVWEVPDLFPLPFEGQTKWVLLASVSTMAPAGGGGVRYFIGDFDGTTFTYDHTAPELWLDYGPDNYAGTTWSDMPDGRRIYIGWMSNWQYAASTPTGRWRGANTLPREFTIVNTADGLRLQQTVVSSVETLRQPLGTWNDVTITGEMPLEGVKGRTLEIIAEIEAGSAERFGLDVHVGAGGHSRIIYNTKRSLLLLSRTEAEGVNSNNGFNPAFGAPTPLVNNRLRLHIFVDRSSVEILAQDGLVSVTGQTFVAPENDGVSLFATDGDAKLISMEIYALDSTWTAESVQPVPGLDCSKFG